jgi:hypothetical protein
MRLSRLNKTNKGRLVALTPEQKEGEDDTAEVWDSDPRYVFMI